MSAPDGGAAAVGPPAEGPPRPLGRLADLVFLVLSGLLMAAMGAVGAPAAVRSPEAGRAAMKTYNRAVHALFTSFTGVAVEVRGRVPDYPCVVAPKHQSLLDVYMLFEALPEARFVMKAELARVPVFAWYTRRVGCITIDRARPGGAREALAQLEAAGAGAGQIVVYPQGTRVAPGVEAPWRRGAAAIALEMGLPLVPVAVNTGHFWSRTGRLAGPGTAVVEFLDPIETSGGESLALTETLRARIEPASARLAPAGTVSSPA
ncbi:MAG: lysophospholipid acyltransferase family protein [Pseudomonadota bacterium]